MTTEIATDAEFNRQITIGSIVRDISFPTAIGLVLAIYLDFAWVRWKDVAQPETMPLSQLRLVHPLFDE